MRALSLVVVFVVVLAVQLAQTNAQPAKAFFVSAAEQRQNANKEFWDRLYHNAFANTKTRYDVLNGDRVCLTCPIDRSMYNNLYHEVAGAYATPAGDYPPRVSITWTSQLPNDHTIFYCRNNTRVSQMPAVQNYDTDGYSEQQRGRGSGEVDFSCENNQLCLNNVRYHYPDSYQCLIRSYVQSVKLNVIVELQSLLLYFGGDSVKFDFQKEVQVFENQVFTVKCEVPETNPVSTVSAYIDNTKLRLTDLKKKPIENRMTINTYLYEVNATRAMNGKRIKCEAQMENLPSEFASLIELRSYISKEYTLSVYYLPTCVYNDRVYKTGINRSLVIECPINGSNPDVTYYKIIPPSPRTKFEQIDTDLETLRRIGRYRINPTSQADFGVYQCIPRSLAGTAQCDIHVELGATPNPPEHCAVQFNRVNNKTFAQFSCRPGFNQGGSSSFLTIYEQTLPDKQLKLSGRINIDESSGDKEVPYITPADEDKYYEFVVVQENNYGNSTPVLLTLGTPEELKVANFWDAKSTYIIAGGVALALFVVCACACCCCSDLLNKPGACCSKCTGTGDEEDGPTYKKGMETFGSHFTYNDVTKDSMNMSSGNQHLLSATGYYDNNSDKDLHSTLYKGRNLKGSSIYKDEVDDDDDDENNEADEDEETPGGGRGGKYDNEDSADEEADEYKRVRGGRGGYMSHSAARKTYYDDDEDDEKAREAAQDLDSLTEKSGSEDNQVYVHTTTLIKQSAVGTNSLRKNPYHTAGRNAGAYRPETRHYGLGGGGGGGSNHYSTIDAKNIKLIQTKNGLVYTSKNGGLNGGRNKSNDALLYNNDDEDGRVGVGANDYEGIYDNKTLVGSSVRPSGGTLRRASATRRDEAVELVGNDSFKMELTQKLKSMSDGKTTTSTPVESGNRAAAKPASASTTTTSVPVYKPITLAQPEHFSNTTATTSISSSASSCASSSDLVIKEVAGSVYSAASTQRATHATEITTTTSAGGGGAKNYSLLKTTLKTAPSSQQNGGGGATDTLGRPKPAITKPKPSLAPGHAKRQNAANTTAVSVHNQSTDALIIKSTSGGGGGVKETSQHTSPSTSVTDVSSTNCTPQHAGGSGGAGSADEQGGGGGGGQFIPSSSSTSSTSSSTKQISRSRSNSLTRHTREPASVKPSVQHHQQQQQQFRTFGGAPDIYGSTLGRSRPPLQQQQPVITTTIDDEISRMNRSNRSGHRTLERRHVKNSEC